MAGPRGLLPQASVVSMFHCLLRRLSAAHTLQAWLPRSWCRKRAVRKLKLSTSNHKTSAKEIQSAKPSASFHARGAVLMIKHTVPLPTTYKLRAKTKIWNWEQDIIYKTNSVTGKAVPAITTGRAKCMSRSFTCDAVGLGCCRISISESHTGTSSLKCPRTSPPRPLPSACF